MVKTIFLLYCKFITHVTMCQKRNQQSNSISCKLQMQTLKSLLKKPAFKLLLGAFGVYIAYIQLSVLNQKIYSQPYPRNSDTSKTDLFQYADLVQMLSALFCLLFSYTSSTIQKQGKNPIPFWEIIILGTLFTLNVNTLNYSLYYIPYPVRVVGDKLGYLTAVIVAVYFTRVTKSKSRLGPEKMWRALMVSVGAMGFAYFYKFKQSQSQLYVQSQRWKGYVLIGISVITQALFSDSQAYNKLSFKPTPNHMMYSINLVTLLFNIVILILSNTLKSSIKFCLTHDQIAMDIFLVAVLTILGQISVYYVVVNFKQHIFPLISTTRKIVTILYSIYYFKHVTNIYMWVCLILVFGGIIYELVDQLYYDLTGEQQVKIPKLLNALKENKQIQKEQ